MNDIYFMWVRVAFADQYTKFNKGDIFLVGNKSKHHFQDQFESLGNKKIAEFFTLSEFFKPYQPDEKGPFTKFIIRSGGIGDLIALSTICNQLEGRIIFLTQSKYFDVFKYYKNKNISALDFTKAVFKGIDTIQLSQIRNKFRMIVLDNTIENGSARNWYEIFYESIKKPVDWERCRPELNCQEPVRENYLLICHRSSANMRSMSFETIYKAVKELRAFDKYSSVCVHDDNLTANDKNFINQLPTGSIKILHAKSTAEYLKHVEQAEMVISVDSAALHLREGLQLPAIGIYNSFSSYCRTAGYCYTKSFDIKSNCELQPCFLHQMKPGQKEIIYNCQFADNDSDIAPCFTDKFTKDLHSQLKENLEICIKQLI